MIKWRHRVALWAGVRILARQARRRGVDASNVIAAGDNLRRVMRG